MLHNQKLDPEICTDNFKNRLVVITGTTSGIGKDAAKKFASKGADILSINRNEEKSKDLCQLLESKYGGSLFLYDCRFFKISRYA